MLYRKEANSRDRKSNIEKGGGGSIVEMRKEICLKHSNMTKCLNTFVAHCSITHIKPENLQHVQKMRFWQKAPGVNGLNSFLSVLIYTMVRIVDYKCVVHYRR